MSDTRNVWTPEAATHVCPRCGSRDTRRSLQRGVVDSLTRMFNYAPYRCRKCACRFTRKLNQGHVNEETVEPGE